MEWLEGESQRLRAEVDIEHDIVGESPPMQRVYQFAKIAPSDSTVPVCASADMSEARSWEELNICSYYLSMYLTTGLKSFRLAAAIILQVNDPECTAVTHNHCLMSTTSHQVKRLTGRNRGLG